jgi:hypothetical protein
MENKGNKLNIDTIPKVPSKHRKDRHDQSLPDSASVLKQGLLLLLTQQAPLSNPVSRPENDLYISI